MEDFIQAENHGDYINDHSIVRGLDGKWHLFGITSFGTGSYHEKYFSHGRGDSLEKEFAEVGKVIDRGTLAWAPCVIEREGNYYMFYGPSPTSLAVSFDMQEWFGTRVSLRNEPLMAAHRDHFVLKLEDGTYLMYVTGVKDKRGAISLFSSSDLLTWDFEGYALTSGENTPLNPPLGAMESPFVLKKDGLYYLFVTYTDCSDATYCNTMVFVSEDPKVFGEFDGEKGVQPITVLKAHAPEILEENGEYYITTCGWKSKPNPNKGAAGSALPWGCRVAR